MKIHTLIENTSIDKSLKPEFGLSLFIQCKNKNILFDTGRSGAFIDNAEKMGIDLMSIDTVVISHAHFDHTGGLGRFLDMNKEARVYIRKKAFDPYFFRIFPFFKKYVGMDPAIAEKHRGRFIEADHLLEIAKDIFIITDIGDRYGRPFDSLKHMTRSNGGLIQDEFEHELMLAIVEDGLLFGFTGCSHHGILNMLEALDIHLSGHDKVIIGGFHMMNVLTGALGEPRENVLDAGNHIARDNSIKKVLTGHCTGNKAFDLLKNILGSRIDYLATGMVY